MIDLVCLDVETTGLNRDHCYVLEMAFVVVDSEYRYLGEFNEVINPPATHDPVYLEASAMALHEGNELLKDIREGKGISIEVATGRALQTLTRCGVDVERPKSLIMIGNNPDFDRAFVKRVFPQLGDLFHYRGIDVSSMREVAARRSGLMTDRLKSACSQAAEGKGRTKHRAMGDVLFALDELRRYTHYLDGASMLRDLRSEGLIS